MNEISARIMILSLCIAPVACALVGGSTDSTLGGDTHNVKLTFIEPRQAQSVFAENQPVGLPPDAREAVIGKLCSGGTLGPAVAPLAALLGSVVSGIIHLGVTKIDQTLQNALKKYSSTYQADATINTYSDKPADFSLRYACFRFSRADKDATKKGAVYLDMIAQMRLAPEGERLQVRPLRLFVSRPEVPSAKQQFNIAISLKAESIWRDNNEGKEGVVFDKTILKEKVTEPPPAFVKYYVDDDKAWIDLPIIPYSTPHKPAEQYGNAKMTLSVVENGIPPELLQKVAKLFSGSKDSLEKLLTSSADNQLGLPKP